MDLLDNNILKIINYLVSKQLTLFVVYLKQELQLSLRVTFDLIKREPCSPPPAALHIHLSASSRMFICGATGFLFEGLKRE